MHVLYFGDIPNIVSCAFSTIPIFPPFNSLGPIAPKWVHYGTTTLRQCPAQRARLIFAVFFFKWLCLSILFLLVWLNRTFARTNTQTNRSFTVQRSYLREHVLVHFTLRYRLPLINKDVRRDIVKVNACTRDFAGDIFTHESTTCSMGEGNSVRG